MLLNMKYQQQFVFFDAGLKVFKQHATRSATMVTKNKTICLFRVINKQVGLRPNPKPYHHNWNFVRNSKQARKITKITLTNLSLNYSEHIILERKNENEEFKKPINYT